MSILTNSRSSTTTNLGNIAPNNDGSFTELDQPISTRTTDLHNFLRTRRSIRRFKPDPVPDSVIQNILTTATFAPSAHNRQPWRFCVVTDPSVKQNLANAMAVDFERDLARDSLSSEKIQAQIKRSKDRITSAPVAILLCLDMSEMDSYPDEKRQSAERTMATQSVAAAGLQLLLAVHAEGLGGVWACWPLFAQEVILNTLNLPKTWEPQAMFFIGYPVEIPEVRERKPLNEIIYYADTKIPKG
ncbi:MAG: nitroreductase family protein [Anaerolineales bacterium]